MENKNLILIGLLILLLGLAIGFFSGWNLYKLKALLEADEKIVSQRCDYSEDNVRKYAGVSPEECQRIRFMCEPERKPFFDECGCGCELINPNFQ